MEEEHSERVHFVDEPKGRTLVFCGFVWTLLTIIVFCVVSFALAQVWPYNNASIEQSGPIQTQTKTSEGVPVIFVGEPIRATVDLCNHGVDIHTDRWLDSYGPVLPETEDFDAPLSERSNSQLLRDSVFYQRGDIGCVDNLSITLTLPSNIQTGIYYRIRANNRYSPNPLTQVNNVTETELFYYAEKGSEIP